MRRTTLSAPIRRSPLTLALAVAAALSLSLAPGRAAASSGRTMAQAVRAVTRGGELPEQAEVHLGRAYDHFNAGAYDRAEAELKRAAFFAPEWQPMTYNLAVVAEAQGHLDEAIERYQSYRPHAEGEQGLVVDQRIAELEERKKQIKKVDRRQLIGASVALGTGLAAVGGGVAFFILRAKTQDKIDALKAMDPVDDAEVTNLTAKAKNYYIGGYILALYGGLALLYSTLYLAKVVKTQKTRKVALRPTAGGAAVAF